MSLISNGYHTNANDDCNIVQNFLCILSYQRNTLLRKTKQLLKLSGLPFSGRKRRSLKQFQINMNQRGPKLSSLRHKTRKRRSNLLKTKLTSLFVLNIMLPYQNTTERRQEGIWSMVQKLQFKSSQSSILNSSSSVKQLTHRKQDIRKTALNSFS